MARQFEGRVDAQALWAAAFEFAELFQLPGIDPQNAALVRAIACDSTYQQVLNGASEKSFIAFQSTRERVPVVYETLQKLGYRAIEASDTAK